MLKRPLRPLAVFLVLSLFYSQNLYAFGSTMLTMSSPALACPINPAFNAPSRSKLPLETTEVTTFTYTNQGEMAGLDPRMASAIGTTVGTTIGQGIATGNIFGQGIVNVLNESIRGGFIAAGTQLLMNKLPDNIGTSFLTSVLASSFNKLINPKAPTNIVDAFLSSLKDLGQKLLAPETLNNLAQAIKTKGLKDALETHAQDVFQRSTIVSMVNAGGTIADFVGSRLAYASETVFKGQQAMKLDLSTSQADLKVYYKDTPTDGLKFLGYEENDGFADLTASGPTLLSADIGRYYDGDTILTQEIEDGVTTKWEIRDKASNALLLEIAPGTEGNYGSIRNYSLSSTLTFRGGDFIDIRIEVPDGENFTEDRFDLTRLTSEEQKLVVSYHLLPGFAGKVKENLPAESIIEFKNGLVQKGVNPKHVHFVPLFEGNNIVRDFFEWNADANGTNEALTNETLLKLRADYANLTPEERSARHVAIAYSGSSNPLLKAISRASDVPIDAVLSWGAPLKNVPTDFSANSRFKTYINAWGSKDDFQTVSPAVGGRVGIQNIGGGVQTFNIEILDAVHNDIWYSDAKWVGKDDPARQEINRRTSDFMQRLTVEPDTLAFLEARTKGVKFENNKYTINLYEINYNE